MSLISGSRLGPYEIISPIGAGGMGEVFRARDTKLNRDVAIKALPAALAQDTERVVRFRREAQILATLNHPNIAAIYGLEEANGTVGLVMELVAGDDLAQRLRGGAIPVDEAVGIAKQMAEALEEAHEKGIVHRDLKPANVKVTPDGKVKVLDFGLAKALEGETGGSSSDSQISHSPTMSRHATEAGLILGTAAYMSPEQARGKVVDKRADIWSFGVVLFEMLAGRRLFGGETVSDTLAAVLREDVPWKRLPASTPPAVVHLLQRCLARDPRQRLRDIGEARLALESKSIGEQSLLAPTSTPRGASLGWLVATIAIAAITGVIAWPSRVPRSASEKRMAILAPNQAPPQEAKISPDARTVAILADDKIWLRKLDQFSATEVPGSEGARTVFWSPDSSHIGFQARGQLWRVSVQGGGPIAIGPVPLDFTPAGGAVWFDAGRIVFTTGETSLMEIMAEGSGPARELLALNREKDVDLHEPSPLPDGQGVMFVLHPVSGTTNTIQAFVSGERRTLFSGSARVVAPAYSPTGHILHEMNGSVWAIPFSPKSLKATGDPLLVAEGARRPSVAHDGTIVMLSGSASTSIALTWVDATGKVGNVISRTRATSPRISPDGRLVAAVVGFGADADIWLFDIERATERRLTFESGADVLPSWSPDGKFVVYQCGTSACARPADGSGSRVELVANARAPRLSPDGRRLLFARSEERPTPGIFDLDIGGPGLSAALAAEPRLVVAPRRVTGAFDLSPNGRFLAYTTRDGGVDAVLVTKFPAAEGKWEIPVRLAVDPRWSADGKKLFVIDELSRLVEIPVDLTDAFVSGRPEVRIAAVGIQRGTGYDRSVNGRSFLVPLPPSATDAQTRILVIQNWSPK